MKTKLTRKDINRKAREPRLPDLAPPPEVEVAAPDPAIPGLREGLGFLAPADFNALLQSSLSFAREVMDMKLPADASVTDKLKLMSLKKEVMASVLSAGVRVNDGALRKKDDDKVAKMLDRVKSKSVRSVACPAGEEAEEIDLFA